VVVVVTTMTMMTTTTILCASCTRSRCRWNHQLWHHHQTTTNNNNKQQHGDQWREKSDDQVEEDSSRRERRGIVAADDGRRYGQDDHMSLKKHRPTLPTLESSSAPDLRRTRKKSIQSQAIWQYESNGYMTVQLALSRNRLTAVVVTIYKVVACDPP
jgi:hypothetical protein